MSTELPVRIIRGLPNAAYHALPALGSSGVKKLTKSPAHFFGLTLDPNRPANEPTPAMKAGTLAHCAVLEPAELASRYVVKPEGYDGRTAAGKAWAAAVSAGVEIIEANQMTTALRQAESIRKLPEVAALLAQGDAEVSAFWQDPATGQACKCRPDWVAPAGNGVILVDLKTCKDASPEGFQRAIINFGYHFQAAWYSDGYEIASGRPVLGFVFTCVESDYPHAAAAYMLDDEAMSKGRAENRRLLQLYSECRAANAWPGYPNTIQALALPAWA